MSKARFWNVTLHISLPATSKEEAEERARKLVDDSNESVNVNVFEDDTMMCDPDEDEFDMEGWSHRYVNDKTGEPLLACPTCQADLTKYESVKAEFIVEKGPEWSTLTQLDAKGGLVDRHGHIREGYHCGTRCKKCGEGLDDYEV